MTKNTASRLPREDLVLAQRKLLFAKKEPKPDLQQGIRSDPLPIYPYTKGPDFSNAGVGYGEVLRITVCCAPKGGVSLKKKGFSRRTRSGRVVIPQTDRHIPKPDRLDSKSKKK